MSNVDWGQAPEGATHKVPTGCWYKVDDHQVYCWCHDHWGGPYSVRQYEDGSFEQMVARPSPQWNGADLPPVGETVIISNDQEYGISEYGGEFLGERCMVRSVFANADGVTMVSVEKVGGACCCFRADMCLPIKTPEHIAADERELFAKTIAFEMGKDPDRNNNAMAQGRRMYDLGYRKQPAKHEGDL